MLNQPPARSNEPAPPQPVAQSLLQQLTQLRWQDLTPKRIRGALLVAIGYLLSPLCWWNDLVFNLPVAYAFGYVCSWISADWLLPGAIVGYWLSNLIGIVMMQFGAIDVLDKTRNFKKDLWTGFVTSTVYTLAILALVQLKVLNLAALLPDLGALFSSAVQ